MPSSSPIADREAAKARVRNKRAARHNLTARDYLYSLLHATHSHSEAEAILDTFERQSGTAARLSRVLDICDKGVRAGDETVAIDKVHAAALGDDVRQSGGAR